MFRVLLIAGLLLLGGVGAFLYWKLQPGDHAGYVMEKELHGDAGRQAIVWNAMPLDAAYQALARNRTPFRPELSNVPRGEADYLGALFGLTDAAVAQRVAIQKKLEAGSGAEADLANYGAIVTGIRALPTPSHLISVEANIFEAISDQRDYLQALVRAAEAGAFDPSDPLVQSAHARLSAATDLLIELYPGESFHNKRAFVDHLVALDFL
jgi:hypothetical protein